MSSIGFRIAADVVELEQKLSRYGTMGEAAKQDPKNMRRLLPKMAVLHGPDTIDLELAAMVGIRDLDHLKRLARREIKRARR